MNVVPSLNVGNGTTIPVSVNYNSEFEKLIIDPILFTASDVETNQIDIVDMDLKLVIKCSMMDPQLIKHRNIFC